MIYNGTVNDYKNLGNSLTMHIVVFVIAFLRIIDN